MFIKMDLQRYEHLSKPLIFLLQHPCLVPAENPNIWIGPHLFTNPLLRTFRKSPFFQHWKKKFL